MKMIKVYQIQLTDAETDAFNRGVQTEKTKAYLSRMFDGTFKPEIFEHYTHVANVATDDMEDAFRLMNLWDDETKVERLGPCSSMSVGDILELEDGSRHRVASWGFAAFDLENA
jgi:hypothetical protein